MSVNSFLSSNNLTYADIGSPFGVAGLDQNASLNSSSIPNNVPLVINNKNTSNNSITLNLTDLGDVNATDDSNSTGKYLSFNGTSWVASNVTTTKSLTQLTDVNVTDDSSSTGKYLQFNGTSWIASTVSQVNSLSQLTNDVSVVDSTSNGKFLKNVSGTWESQNISESDVSNLITDLSNLTTNLSNKADLVNNVLKISETPNFGNTIEYWVDCNYALGNSDGSIIKPFTTITNALNAVGTGTLGGVSGTRGTYGEPTSSSDPYYSSVFRIFVKSGYYSESPVIPSYRQIILTAIGAVNVSGNVFINIFRNSSNNFWINSC